MEKILWVKNYINMIGKKEDDGLKIVNEYLEKDWGVKHISACAMGDGINSGQAYIVIERKD